MGRFYYEDAEEPWRPDGILRQFLGRKGKQIRRLAALARDDKPRALDLGMGYGRNAVWLAEQGYVVEGWERDGRYVAEARRRWKDATRDWRPATGENTKEKQEKLVVRRGDFTKAKLGGRYDVVVISQALHQVKRSAALRVLQRVRTALAPGGRLFLLAKLTSDRHVQRVRRDPAWKQVKGERNTYLRPEKRRRGSYHSGRPRTPQMYLSALEPKEIRRALKGLRVVHWRTVVLRSDWEEEQPVTHTVAEIVAERRE